MLKNQNRLKMGWRINNLYIVEKINKWTKWICQLPNFSSKLRPLCNRYCTIVICNVSKQGTNYFNVFQCVNLACNFPRCTRCFSSVKCVSPCSNLDKLLNLLCKFGKEGKIGGGNSAIKSHKNFTAQIVVEDSFIALIIA